MPTKLARFPPLIEHFPAFSLMISLLVAQMSFIGGLRTWMIEICIFSCQQL